MRGAYGWAILLVLVATSSAACGDDSSSPDDAEGGTASGGAASGGTASGGTGAGGTASGEAGAPTSGGSEPASAGAGGAPTEAGRGPGGEANGAAGGGDSGSAGADLVVGNPERDIERTALDIDLAAQTARKAWYPATCNVVDVVNSGLFNRMTYLKGAFLLRALEEKVGRAAFDEALSTFYTRFAGDAARVQDLLDVVNEVTDYDARGCAEDWLALLPIPPLAACP